MYRLSSKQDSEKLIRKQKRLMDAEIWNIHKETNETTEHKKLLFQVVPKGLGNNIFIIQVDKTH